jgi:ABC-type dipeptide/oligopeptide/nickel transport system permease subunit
MNFNNRSMNTIELLILRLGGKVEPEDKRSMVGIMVLMALLSVVAVLRILRLEMMNLRNKIKARRTRKK